MTADLLARIAAFRRHLEGRPAPSRRRPTDELRAELEGRLRDDPADLAIATDASSARDAAAAAVAYPYRRPAWHRDAACIGTPTSVFFPGRGESNQPALELCGRCPVRRECLAEALAIPAREDWGIRGGMTAAARQAVRRNQKRASAC